MTDETGNEWPKAWIVRFLLSTPIPYGSLGLLTSPFGFRSRKAKEVSGTSRKPEGPGKEPEGR